MTSRERIKTIIAGGKPDRCGFWLGNPHPDSLPKLFDYFSVNSEEELHRYFNDDFRWICPQYMPGVYQHPDGLGLFEGNICRESQAGTAPFANCEHVRDVEKFPWPNPDYLNFDICLEILKNIGDVYRASGFWTCFYHNVMDLFGMESYLVKMYTHSEVVRAVTNKVCEFYYEANERFFQAAGDLVDGFFFGNDFGTQQDLICGPAQFDEFILPWFTKFTEQGHRHRCQVILHSCGSIHKVIERLINAGVDCLHPLQANAADMNARKLSADFKGKIAFLGGIDTQDLLVNAKPEEIKEEVRRVKHLLGPNLIISPSHEALLPDVPPENILAMAEAAVQE